MTHSRLSSLFALSLVLAGAAAVQFAAAAPVGCTSTSIFCSDFEEGSFAIWDDGDGNPSPWNLLMSDPGPLNVSGNTVARLRVPAGRGTTDLLKVLPEKHDKVYLRWYQQWEPGYDFNAQNHGSGLHAGETSMLGRSGIRPSGSDRFIALLEPYYGRMTLYTYYRGMYQDCSNPNGGCFGDQFPCIADDGQNYCKKPEHRERIMPPMMRTGQWYCLEMMMDGGTPVSRESEADGALNFWIDDVEYGPWENLWMRTTPDLKISVLWLSQFFHQEHSEAGIMIDDVVVSTERIGCASGVKKPKPPTDLRVSGLFDAGSPRLRGAH